MEYPKFQKGQRVIFREEYYGPMLQLQTYSTLTQTYTSSSTNTLPASNGYTVGEVGIKVKRPSSFNLKESAKKLAAIKAKPKPDLSGTIMELNSYNTISAKYSYIIEDDSGGTYTIYEQDIRIDDRPINWFK